MIGNKIADRITKISRTSSQNSLEVYKYLKKDKMSTYSFKNEYNKEIIKERYISLEEKNHWWSEINIIV